MSLKTSTFVRTMLVLAMVGALALTVALANLGVVSRENGPRVLTNKATFVGGERVLVSGYGFLPFEQVTLQIDGSGGKIAPPWSVTADGEGRIESDWALDADVHAGADLLLTASGGSSKAQVRTLFRRTATLAARDAEVTGSDFEPRENVTLRLGPDGEPWFVTTDDKGGFTSPFPVQGDGSPGATTLDASGDLSGLSARTLLVAGGFSIDGSVPDGAAIGFGDPFGSASELGPVNSTSTKLLAINGAAPPMLSFTNPNAQVDLRTIWMATNVVNSEAWLYFAWERDSNSGSGVIAFEFQQAARPAACDYTKTDQVDSPANSPAGEASLIASCNPWANRQPGDFLIVWDASGGKINIIKRTFYLDGAGKVALDAGVILSAADSAAAVSADKYRGEAAINLSHTVFPQNPTSCFSIANIIPGTVTGNSDSADYKDTLLADFASRIAVSNCGQVKVTKVTQPAGGTGSFPYTLARQGGQPVRFPGDGGETSLGATLVADQDSDVYLKLIGGNNYTLGEGAVGPAWANIGIMCGNTDLTSGGTFAVLPSVLTECTITNKLQNGTLIVKKVVTNNDGGTATCGNFGFQVNGSTATPFEADCQNEISVDTTVSYTVTEPAVAGYAASYSNCTSVQVPPGGSATCTITNDDLPPSLRLVKSVTNNSGGTATPSQWQLTATGASGFTDAGNSTTFHAVAAGVQYTLSESSVSGYDFVSWSCDGGTFVAPNKVTLGLSQQVTCTVTNDDRPPSLRLVKSVTNNNGGTATSSAWQLTATGTAGFTDAGNSVTFHTVMAGVQYALSESSVSGYDFVSWSCDGGTFVAPNKVTLGLDQQVTCTVTNDDRKATPGVATVERAVLHDAATVSGIRTGAPGPAATVTFRLFSDAACANQVGSDETVGISGGGQATTVNGVLVTAPGTYYWRAFYSGDTFNASFATACGSEVTTVGF